MIEHGASGEERIGIVRHPRARPYSPVGPAPLVTLSAHVRRRRRHHRRRRPLRWWVEIGLTVAFYVVYSAIRNQFGSALGDSVRDASFRNAERIIDIEQAMGLYVEEWIHNTFLAWDWFIVFWNVFYGTFHFAVTIGAMVLLFARHPERYTFMRSTLAATTGVALVGFAFFPLMPPRLLGTARPVWACEDGFDYTDTLVDPGGLWSFESGTMETISNQYAAMPSLHIAWAIWCTVALLPGAAPALGSGPDRGVPDRDDVRDRRHGEPLLA